MSRGAAVIDRIATALTGLALLAGGLALILWAAGLLDQWTSRTSSKVSTDRLVEITGEPWWPWAAGIGGALVGAAALWWLLAHLPARHSAQLALSGSDSTGRLGLDLTSVADTAAAELAAVPGVRSARANIRRDRGQRTLDLTGVCEHSADLALVAAGAGTVCADLAAVLDDATPPTRIHLHTPRKARRSRNLR